ncbi:hypothetical protein ACFWC9_33985 [Streptomyces goshikiensis]|uniref:hypothetical protein n=1 Tax=Streptomyces goshikiensis TaxID=1942 RepID=UPI003697F9D2
MPLASSGTVSLSPPGPVKVTVPVGVPLPGATAVTSAHRVTVWPHTEGLGFTERVVVLAAWLTVTGAVPVDGRKQESPL